MTNHSAMLAALADPTRRAIFERLAKAPSSVGEVARELPVSRPAVSQHLKVLKSAGLVSDQAAGTRRVYSVNPAGIGAIRDYFEQFWQESLTRFAAAASQQAGSSTPRQAESGGR
jgi:DNA-binding transcriptional ArsR family regulator